MPVYLNTFRSHLFNYSQHTDHAELQKDLDKLGYYTAYARPKDTRYGVLVYRVSKGGKAEFEYAKPIQTSERIHASDFSYPELTAIGDMLKIPEFTQNMYLLGYFDKDMQFTLGEVRFSKENNLHHGLHIPLKDLDITPTGVLHKYDYKSTAMIITHAIHYNNDVLFVPTRNWNQAILYKTY